MEHSRSDEFDRELERIWREAATTRSPLPTELELAKALGVSRPMVREALVKLEAQGLIARRAHQGTFANVVALSVPFRIDQSYELTERLVQVGYEVKVDVVRAEWSTLRNDEADDLEATPGMPCFRVAEAVAGRRPPPHSRRGRRTRTTTRRHRIRRRVLDFRVGEVAAWRPGGVGVCQVEAGSTGFGDAGTLGGRAAGTAVDDQPRRRLAPR